MTNQYAVTYLTYMLYDDVCNIKKFLNKRKLKTSRGQKLNEKKHFINKLHILNHKDPWCIANCDPYKEPELNGINTVVCEQFNFWGDGFKFMIKIMKYQSFHFFLFIMFDFYNIQKLKR